MKHLNIDSNSLLNREYSYHLTENLDSMKLQCKIWNSDIG